MSTFSDLLGNAISGVNKSTAELTQLGQSLAGNTAQLQQLSTTSAEEGRLAVAGAQKAAGMKAAAEFQQRSVAEKAQNILNINPDVADNELQLSVNALNASQRQYKDARVEYDQITQTQLLDDPVGYIFGQLKLPQVAARVNAASDAQASALSNINERYDLAAKAKSTVVANTAGMLQEAGLVQAAADASAANMTLAGKEMENASRIAGAWMQQAQVTDKINDNKARLVQMQLSNAQFEATQAARDAAREQAHAFRADRVSKLNEQKESDDLWNARLKPLGQFIGMGLELNVKTIKAFNKQQQDALIEAAANYTLGADLSDSLKLLAKIPGRAEIGSTNKGVGTFLDGATQGISNYAASIEADARKTGQKVDQKTLTAVAAQDYQADVVRSWARPDSKFLLSSERWDSTFNPGRADHDVMADIAAAGKVKGINASNPMLSAITTVRSTLQGKPFTAEDEQRALMVVRDRVAKRELPPREAAAQVSAYYQAAVARNADVYQSSMFGLPKQESYYFSLKPAGLLGDAIKADLMNPASLERAFTADVRGYAQAQAKYGGQFGVGPLLSPVSVAGALINAKIQDLFGSKE